MQKTARILADLILPWSLYDVEIGIEIVGDNELVINWINGQAAAVGQLQKCRIEMLANHLGRAWQEGFTAPRTPSADWCRHVYRERNVAADTLANKAMDEKTSSMWHSTDMHPKMQQLCAHFDGGKRGDVATSCGWHLQGSLGADIDGEPVWHTLAWGSVLLDPGLTTVEAELAGLTEALGATLSWARHGLVHFADCRVKLPA